MTEQSGEYRIQYSDEAEQQAQDLSDDLWAAILHKLRVAATTNPYRRGVPEDGIRDRVRVKDKDQGVSALVWISEDLRIMTVVQVRVEAIEPVPLQKSAVSSAESSREEVEAS